MRIALAGNNQVTVMPKDYANRMDRVCGIPVHSWAHEDILAEMERNISGPRDALYISITNTESMYHARRISEHYQYINNARFSLCDGMGVVISARLQRKNVTRFNGPALMLKSCEYGVERNWRHYFCGGKEGVADLLSKKLTSQFPGMITAGTLCPPFREMTPDEETNLIKQINDARPDILWVGLGLLKQEAWIHRYIDKLDVPWLIGVGAAFDYHAGTARWAPSWIRSIGMEWLYRLYHEPRMLKRNIWSFVFLFEAALESIFEKAPYFGRRQ